MNDIGRWLEALELERYRDVFIENEITLAALPFLTDEDLKEMGVALGARRLILSKAAALEAPAETNTIPSGEEAAPEAERRQLSVLFCDLVGSTERSRAMDPEDYRDLIRAYQDVVAGLVTRYDGHIAKYMGDGVLAYFGFPLAHEDDAARAALASLDIVAAVKRIDAGEPLAVRIGVASGLVVVGDIVGDAGAQEQAVVGDTPNLAARLQALAEPGQVLFCETSQRLCRGRFDFSDLGRHDLKGFELPVTAWLLQRESQNVDRFDAAQKSRPGPETTRFIGRDEELLLLRGRLTEASRGKGQVALLSGEAGIGKSRLMAAILQDAQSQGFLRARYQCSPLHTRTTYYPIIRQLRQLIGLHPDEDPDTALEKIAGLFLPDEPSRDRHVATVATIMSVPLPEAFRAATPEPRELHQALFDALYTRMSRLSGEAPILLCIEDLHWIDPASLAFFEQIVRGLADLRVMAVATFRPDFKAAWADEANVLSLHLTRLSDEMTKSLARDLAADLGHAGLPEATLNAIASRSDGVPMFAEELTLSLLESPDNAGESGAIPATLQDILAARLDRLGPAREVAQIGAVIGREFSFELLAALGTYEADRLHADLSAIEASGLISKRGDGPDATFNFKHALVQDAAYDSLLRRRRQEMHRFIAEALVQKFPERAELEPHSLAHHLEASGNKAQAASYWFAAGKRTMGLGATSVAIDHYQHAIALIDGLDDADAHAELNLDCHIALNSALTFVQDVSVADKLAVNDRATRLCEIVKDDHRTFKVTWGRWYLEHFAGHDPTAAVETANKLLHIGQRQNDQAYLLQAHHSAWTSLWSKEDMKATIEHTDAGIRLYDVDKHRHHWLEFGGHDAGMCCHNLGGMVRGFMGELDSGLAMSRKGVRIGQEIEHPPSEFMGRGFMTTLYLLRRQAEPLFAWVDELTELAGNIDGPYSLFTTTPLIIQGWMEAASGDVERGIARIEDNLAKLQKSGFPKIGFQKMLLADAHIEAGDYDIALDLLGKARENGRQMNEQIWIPEIARIEARSLLAQSHVEEAIGRLQEALSVAERHGTVFFQLRAARDLAALWARQTKFEEAATLLEPLYQRVTEARDTPDLLEAKALLDELR
jgi:class 3 adenylate cyclase/tetratricopeptide (TPR) repeat protein